MTVLNWSERNELHDPTGTEHDCYVAAPLTCLVFGGKTDYPLGIYTAQEREALERSDTRPDEEGGTPDDADLAILTRYGIAMHKVAEASLGDAWKVGRALSVGGRLANFPAGAHLRRWAPDYLGGHRWAVVPTSPLSGTLFDPLAPWKYAGEPVSLAEVGLFAKGRAASDLRYTNQNEYVTGGTGGGIDIMGLPTQLPATPAIGTVDIPHTSKAIRLSDGSHPSTDNSASARVAYAAQLAGTLSGPGYYVELGSPRETYFIREADCSFTPSKPASGDVTHQVTVNVDGVTKATVTV